MANVLKPAWPKIEAGGENGNTDKCARLVKWKRRSRQGANGKTRKRAWPTIDANGKMV